MYEVGTFEEQEENIVEVEPDRPRRNIIPPAWLEDYVVSIAEVTVDDEDVQMLDAIKSHLKNYTWTIIENERGMNIKEKCYKGI